MVLILLENSGLREVAAVQHIQQAHRRLLVVVLVVLMLVVVLVVLVIMVVMVSQTLEQVEVEVKEDQDHLHNQVVAVPVSLWLLTQLNIFFNTFLKSTHS